MRTFYCALIICLAFLACNQRAPRCKIFAEDSLQVIKNYKQALKTKDSMWAIRENVFRSRFLKLLDLPDLKTLNREAYILYISRPHFVPPDFVFFIEEIPGGEIQLTTKFIVIDVDSTYPRYCGDMTLTHDTVLESSKQIIPRKDWFQFLGLLNSSYYWAFEDPCPDGTGILDGESYILESKTWHCADNKMKYHRLSVHCILRGSLEQACLYLINLSDLARKYGVNKYYNKRVVDLSDTLNPVVLKLGRIPRTGPWTGDD